MTAVASTYTGLCVICRGQFGDFGRETYHVVDGRIRLAGYSCRECTTRLEQDQQADEVNP